MIIAIEQACTNSMLFIANGSSGSHGSFMSINNRCAHVLGFQIWVLGTGYFLRAGVGRWWRTSHATPTHGHHCQLLRVEILDEHSSVPQRRLAIGHMLGASQEAIPCSISLHVIGTGEDLAAKYPAISAIFISDSGVRELSELSD
jgi:hypothetical protein